MGEPKGPVLRALQRRVWRRRLVVGMYAGYLGYLGSLAWVHPAMVDGVFWLVRLPLFGLAVACYYLLHRVTYEAASRPDSALDEREMAQRAASYRTAYRVVALLVVPLVAYTLLAVDYPGRLLTPFLNDLLSELYIFLVLMTLTLPATITAWREPDPVEDEDGVSHLRASSRTQSTRAIGPRSPEGVR